MKSGIVAAIQMHSGADTKENLLQAERLIQAAVQQQANIIILPEMFVIYGKTDAGKLTIAEKYGEGVIQDFLSAQAAKHQVWIVGGTIPIRTQNPLKTRAACLVYNADGEHVARYDKIHLFDVFVGNEPYQESKHTEPGDNIVVIETPFGKVGLAVCYDIRFPELMTALINQGAEIIAVPTAFTQVTGIAHWEILIRALAIQSQCYIIAGCQVGAHPNGRQTYGHSMIINPWGEILKKLPTQVGVICATLDASLLKEIRDNMPLQQQRRLVNKQGN